MEGDLSVRDGDRCTASGDLRDKQVGKESRPEMAYNGTINANFCTKDIIAGTLGRSDPQE